MLSVGLLFIRSTIGVLLAGHGAQKLFGLFEGHGVDGTAGWMESMNLKPGRLWAMVAGLSEFGGGVLTALGALNPLGPIGAIGAMLMATLKVHRGKPIWVTAGGAELPVTNIAVMAGLIFTGPGKLSFDGLLGIRIPRWFGLFSLVSMIVAVAYGIQQSNVDPATEATATEQQAGGELQAEGTAGVSSTEGTIATDDSRPDPTTEGPNNRPGIESWGSPDDTEAPVEDPAIAAINREVP